MRLLIILFLLVISMVAEAKATNNEISWGLGLLIRHAEISFDTKDDHVSSAVPMMFYEGDTFFLHGIEGGAHLYEKNDWQFNAMARLRFFDIPAEYQNQVQGDTFDFGIQWKKSISDNHYVDVEVFSDLDGNAYASIRSGWYFQHNDWEFMPKISARYKSASFNSQYFSLSELTHENIGAGVDFKANIETRFHVTSNLYLVGSFGVTALDNNAYHSSAINQRWQSETYLGFAFFNDRKEAKHQSFNNSGYVRVAHGWATPSNIGDIISGGSKKDEFNNQLSSIFHGLPLTDKLFSLPIDIYLTTGFTWHWQSEVQESQQEYILAIKAYYTIDWPIKWRIGLAEGLSYISNVTYIEKTEMEEKGYTPSKLMNYIDFSVDINLGDIFNVNALNSTWLGYSIHHRSSIFESAAHFGRIKGGSNYNTVYVQFDF